MAVPATYLTQEPAESGGGKKRGKIHTALIQKKDGEEGRGVRQGREGEAAAGGR